MKKIISLFLVASCLFSAFALAASAAYSPMTVEEMSAALDEKNAGNEFGGMALGWGFDDIKTKTVEYVKNAYSEASTLAKAGKYTFTEESADAVTARGVDGLVSVATLVKKDGSESVTLYKFSDISVAESYAAVLTEKNAPAEEGAESEIYVRACGETVCEGNRNLVYKIGVTVVDNAVVHGDFLSTDYEEMESGLYESLKNGATSGMQFKTPDSAIIYRNGELVISKAQKDYYVTSGSYSGYQSVDTYMDIYATSFSYDELHELHGGESFVLSARLRAPYSYLGTSISGTMNIFVPRCAFNVKVGDVQKKLTIDQTVLQYDVGTREIYLISGGTKMSTGIYLSDYEYTTIAVHIKPKTNSFDFYADGVPVAKDAKFLSDTNLANVHADPTADPTGSGLDYTLTRVRLFYMNYKNLTGDLLCIDDFAWYFSDEYLEKAEYENTVVARSVSIGDKLYLNFYLNLNKALIYDYTASVTMTVNNRTVEIMNMTGTPVSGGEYDGLMKYSVGVDATELGENVTLSLRSQQGRTLYLYGDTNTVFRGIASYTTSVKDCLAYIIDDGSYSDETRALARAALNYGAAVQNYYAGIKFGTGNLKNLPNEGYEYTDELDAVTAESLNSAVESELYKTYTSIGDVPLLSVMKNTLSFDDGIYIDVSYKYTGMKKLTVNGEEPTGVYRININGPDAINSVYTVVFSDGTNCLRLKVSPFHLAANMMSVNGAPDYTVTLIKILYLYNRALENYLAVETED